MEQCKYCNNMFKRVASHINACPSRLQGKTEGAKENRETPNLTPCPHCMKMFKRVAAHVYRCPEKPEENEEMPDGNDSSSEEKDNDNGETSNLTPCPHCKKMFKRVAAHIYRCPEKPKENEEMPNGKTIKNDSSAEEKDDDNEEATNLTPCPHCKKMFKRVAAHVYRCPEKPKENEAMPNGKTIKNVSSAEEKDADNEEASNMTPCPHCKKMFKRVGAHIYRCPEKPKENEEMPDGKTIKNDSALEEKDDDNEEAANRTPCPHCKKMFNLVLVHISKCPVRSDKNIKDKEVADNTATHRSYETASICKPSKNTVPKTLFDHSEHRTNFSVAPVFNLSPEPQRPESEKGDTEGATHKLTCQPIHGDYLLSTKQKTPASIDPALSKPTLYSFSAKNYESWETESGFQVTPMNLKRPPIHDNHSLHHEVQTVDGWSLTDYGEDNSFSKSSESEDSFSYLHQDLKRPAIHEMKSPLLKEANKKLQFPSDEEFFEFGHHVSRE